jgi:hypothetical protein
MDSTTFFSIWLFRVIITIFRNCQFQTF